MRNVGVCVSCVPVSVFYDQVDKSEKCWVEKNLSRVNKVLNKK